VADPPMARRRSPVGSRSSTQLIDLHTPVDRAVLVGAPDRDLDLHLAEEHLEELARLTDTAGGGWSGA